MHVKTRPSAVICGRILCRFYHLNLSLNIIRSCRDGVEKPPPMSKRNVEAICANTKGTSYTNSQPNSPVARRPKPRAKAILKPCEKPDARLQHLESLHQKTNVKKNLKISDQHRIKVGDEGSSPSAAKGKGKRRVAPNFDFDFVDLDEGRKKPNFDLAEVVDSDTELPDPHEILDAYGGATQQNRPPSDPSETNYSNSEVDALIRNAPLFGSSTSDSPLGTKFDHASPAEQIAADKISRESSSLPTWTTLSPSPLARKRKASVEHTPPRTQRRKVSKQVTSPRIFSLPDAQVRRGLWAIITDSILSSSHYRAS